MGTSDILPRKGRGGCNPAMDWYPVQGGVAILLGMLHAKETRISCGHLGLWLICAFTFFYHSHKMHLLGSCTDQNDRFLFPFINSTSEIPTLSYTWSLKEVPPSGVASLGPFKANVESTPPPPGVLLAQSPGLQKMNVLSTGIYYYIEGISRTKHSNRNYFSFPLVY